MQRKKKKKRKEGKEKEKIKFTLIRDHQQQTNNFYHA